MKKGLLFALAGVAVLIAGCGQEETDYEQKVELSPEQQAQADRNMQGQSAPGQMDSSPGEALPMPAGKSGS